MRLSVRVTPSARHNAVEGWQTGVDGHAQLKVSVTAAPERGKANKAVVKLIAKALKVAPGTIEVVRGETARQKTLQIAGDPVETARRIAETWGASSHE